MLSKEHQLNYEKELKIVFGTVCDGFRQEVRYRQLKMLQLPTEKENFDLSYEHERAIVSILAFYIRTAGFLVRPEHYWCDKDEKLKRKTPDLAIWLPRTMTDFFLEVKRIDSPVKYVSSDLDKLSKAQTSNKYNGLLVFGFAHRRNAGSQMNQAILVEHLGGGLGVNRGQHTQLGHHEDGIHRQAGNSLRHKAVDEHQSRLLSSGGVREHAA